MKLATDTEPYGGEILKITYLAQILLLVNHAFLQNNLQTSDSMSEFVQRVMEYVEENLEEPISLEKIAENMHMDKYYMSHRFKKETGDSSYHFILMKRIARARYLLGQGISVTEVCEKSGFNNYNNFIRTFRKYVEMSPGEYRKYRKGILQISDM